MGNEKQGRKKNRYSNVYKWFRQAQLIHTVVCFCIVKSFSSTLIVATYSVFIPYMLISCSTFLLKPAQFYGNLMRLYIGYY